MIGYLVAEEGPLAGLVIEFSEGTEWTLGRDPDEAAVVLEDPMVSRRHALVRTTTEGFQLENFSSINPITQNGLVVEGPVLLHEGDILQIGSTFFRFTENRPSIVLAPEEQSPLTSFGTGEMLPLEGTLRAASRWFLKVVSGPNAGAEFQMQTGASYILGKDPGSCDILLQDLSVSRQHAKLWIDEEARAWIEDLGSRNGVVVNGELISAAREIYSQDLVSLGTTSMLLIDREQVHETIFSPLAEQPSTETPQPEVASEVVKEAWKDLVIPRKHLVLAGLFSSLLLASFFSLMSLFHAESIEIARIDHTIELREALKAFPGVQFSYNDNTGKLFLAGHVLTTTDLQEMLYNLSTQSYISSQENSVVVDELVWQNTNDLLSRDPAWVGVSLYSLSPGRFVLRGYLKTPEEGEQLVDYMNRSFPYLDRLENQVVIESILEMRIQSMLSAHQLAQVQFALNNGELLLSGLVDQKSATELHHLVQEIRALPGIRTINNFVVETSGDTSLRTPEKSYKVTGFSRRDNGQYFVVVEGRILSVGDELDGMRIIEISSNWLHLEKDGVKYKIDYNLQ